MCVLYHKIYVTVRCSWEKTETSSQLCSSMFEQPADPRQLVSWHAYMSEKGAMTLFTCHVFKKGAMTLLNGHVVKRHGAFSEISRCDHNVVQIATKNTTPAQTHSATIMSLTMHRNKITKIKCYSWFIRRWPGTGQFALLAFLTTQKHQWAHVWTKKHPRTFLVHEKHLRRF